MPLHQPRPFEPNASATPPEVYHDRRSLLIKAGLGTAAIAAAGGGWYWWQRRQGTPEEVLAAGQTDVENHSSDFYPATRNEAFQYGRPESEFHEVARHTNFYEFSSSKMSWRLVRNFNVSPWTVTIDGRCRNPLRLDIDEFLKQFAHLREERQYRHRCVERWAMAVPWTGFPLRDIIQAADPLPDAKYVRFVSFERPSEAPNMKTSRFPWPYREGLTMAEAMNELPFIAVGMYGEPLLKQNGAPIRLIVPWKYGYKSSKSIVHIELTQAQPRTFWSTLNPSAYPFESNVDPEIPRPWPQKHEYMLGTGTVHETQKYNGYGKWVAGLYA